jgi:hypothetical protein
MAINEKLSKALKGNTNAAKNHVNKAQTPPQMAATAGGYFAKKKTENYSNEGRNYPAKPYGNEGRNYPAKPYSNEGRNSKPPSPTKVTLATKARNLGVQVKGNIQAKTENAKDTYATLKMDLPSKLNSTKSNLNRQVADVQYSLSNVNTQIRGNLRAQLENAKDKYSTFKVSAEEKKKKALEAAERMRKRMWGE